VEAGGKSKFSAVAASRKCKKPDAGYRELRCFSYICIRKSSAGRILVDTPSSERLSAVVNIVMEWAEIEGRTPGVTAGGNPAMCL
jgi:hypothetical protein